LSMKAVARGQQNMDDAMGCGRRKVGPRHLPHVAVIPDRKTKESAPDMPPFRTFACAFALLTAVAVPGGVSAQVMNPNMLHGLSNGDTAAIRAAADAAIRTSRAGEAQAWKGPGGRKGKATLLAGGEKAGAANAQVKVTETKNGKDWALYTLKYKRDATGKWAATS